MNKKIHMIMIVTAVALLVVDICFAAWVVREGDRVYIEDQTGERWDVTQAETLGFKPQRFQFGIGKNAFTPLSNEDFAGDGGVPSSNSRVIGISIDDNAHAYTVGRLRHHEIANTTIAGKAIVAGY